MGVRIRLLLWSACALLSGPVFADGDVPAQLDEIQVTGSRIRRPDYEVAQPVLFISREQIDRSGVTNLGDLLQTMTSAGAGGNLVADAFATGAVEVDLRNLGSSRTLILVDGHRWVSGTDLTSVGSVDVSTIPLPIVDHVEVLQDGASAVYGSDAVAGVINIITRKNFTGTALSTQFGTFQQGDGVQQLHDVMFGRQFGDTNVLASFTYKSNGPIYYASRDLTREPVVNTGNSRGTPFDDQARFVFVPNQSNGGQLGTTRCPGAANALLPPAATKPIDDNWRGFSPGTSFWAPIPGAQLCDIVHTAGTPGTALSDFHALAPSDYANPQGADMLSPDIGGYSGFVSMSRPLGDLNWTAQALYDQRHRLGLSIIQLIVIGDYSPLVLGNGTNLATYITRNNAYNPFGQDIGRFDPNDPDNQALAASGKTDVGVGVGAVADLLPQVGNFKIVRDASTTYVHTALAGSSTLGRTPFDWEAGVAYAEIFARDVIPEEIRTDRLQRALGPDCTGDCVALDLFQGPDAITPAMINYLLTAAGDLSWHRQWDAYGNATGSFDAGLPAGPLRAAAGVELRHDSFEFRPDDLFQQGLLFDLQYAGTHGAVDAHELYGELSVPLLRDRPFVRELELTPAVRFSQYPQFGSKTNGRLGLRWKPIDTLLLRASYSTAFRAPDVGNLYLGSVGATSYIVDPCVAPAAGSNAETNCNADGVPSGVSQLSPIVRAPVQGNPDLRPEDSRSLSAGFVVSPDGVPGLEVTADYFRFDLKNYIVLPQPQSLIDACYRADADHRHFCDAIDRASSSGQIVAVRDTYENYSRVVTSGVDASVSWRLPTANLPLLRDLGNFRLAADATYLLAFDVLLPGVNGDLVTEHRAGRQIGAQGFPRLRFNPALLWSREAWSASWSAHFLSGQTEPCADGTEPSLSSLGLCSDPNHKAPDGTAAPENRLPPAARHDVQATYAPPGFGGEWALGVQNVLDTDPPVSYYSMDYDAADYWVPGRFVYVRLKKDLP